MSDTITSLIEKLEGGETGSRELDWLIADATGHPSFARKIEGIWPPFMERSRADKDVPAYSTSLDAALALAERVLPGARVMVERFHDGKGWTMVQCDPESAKIMTDGNTPALALCIAILRATQAEDGKPNAQ